MYTVGQSHTHKYTRVELHVFSLEWQNWNLITHSVKRHKLHTDIQPILSENVADQYSQMYMHKLCKTEILIIYICSPVLN